MAISLLNLKLLSLLELALAVLCFVFQVSSLAINPWNPYEVIGIGIWGGFILALTAVSAYKASLDHAPFFLGFTLAMSLISIFVSFSIVGILSASVDLMNRLDPALLIFPNPAAVGLDAMLIVIGLIGAVVNALISVTCITIYKPAATAAPGA